MKKKMIPAAALVLALALAGCGGTRAQDGRSSAARTGEALSSSGNLFVSDGTEGTATAGSADGAGAETPDAEPVEWTGTFFDTVISLRIYGDDAQEWLDGAVDLCGQMEDTLSAQKEGAELYRVNHRTTDRVEISDDLAACIGEGLKYCELSDGAFDITILPVKDLWNFETEDHVSQVPDDADIQKQLKKVDYTKVHLDGNTLTFDSPDTQIDLGGIAKGYISHRLNEFLREQGCRSALINLGGNVSTVGTKPDGTKWVVGIQKPFSDRGEILTTVESADEAVISSGIYERYFRAGGKLYHHILDPRTGYPADTDLNQVTVIGADDTACDALATIGIVTGKEGLEKIIQAQNLPVEVAFADQNNKLTWYPADASHAG